MINVASTAKRRRLLQQKERRQLDLFTERPVNPIGNRKLLKERIEILISKKTDPPDGRKNNRGNTPPERKNVNTNHQEDLWSQEQK